MSKEVLQFLLQVLQQLKFGVDNPHAIEAMQMALKAKGELTKLLESA